MTLANLVRIGQAPAAELIVLDAGRALTDAVVTPVLRAFSRIATLQPCLAQLRDPQTLSPPARARRAIEAQVGLCVPVFRQRCRVVQAREADLREVKRQLIEATLRLVVSTAKRYLGRGLSSSTSSRKGTCLGLSRERVRQIEVRAVAKIRRRAA